ncbi:hypothetical protein NL676_012628 [Syzygium grande]|nr:hypothetical protein NL676_012628 [Syzygium grande]
MSRLLRSLLYLRLLRLLPTPTTDSIVGPIPSLDRICRRYSPLKCALSALTATTIPRWWLSAVMAKAALGEEQRMGLNQGKLRANSLSKEIEDMNDHNG